MESSCPLACSFHLNGTKVSYEPILEDNCAVVVHTFFAAFLGSTLKEKK
jgi:hypothetical protein